MRKLAFVLAAAAATLTLASPGAADADPKCRRGEAGNIAIRGAGAGGAPRALCASGTARSVAVTLKTGTLSYLEVFVPNGLVEVGKTTCAKGELEAVVRTDEPNPLAFQAKDFTASNSLVSSGVQCALTAGRQGRDRIAGHFEGKLLRSRADGSDEFLEISFDYWIRVEPEEPDEDE